MISDNGGNPLAHHLPMWHGAVPAAPIAMVATVAWVWFLFGLYTRHWNRTNYRVPLTQITVLVYVGTASILTIESQAMRRYPTWHLWGPPLWITAAVMGIVCVYSVCYLVFTSTGKKKRIVTIGREWQFGLGKLALVLNAVTAAYVAVTALAMADSGRTWLIAASSYMLWTLLFFTVTMLCFIAWAWLSGGMTRHKAAHSRTTR